MNPPGDGRGRGRGKGRGMARGQSRPVGPSANQQGPPRQPGNVAPRLPGPRPAQPQPVGLNAPRVPKPQTSKPAVPQSSMSSEVEQVRRGLSTMTAGDAPVAIGRGAIRGRQQIVINEHYRAPRPQSSMTKNGKQGNSGTPVTLISNYFPIKTYTEWTLYQYRVDFSPEEDRVMVQRGLLSTHKDFLGAYIFDGSMMFSSTKYKSNKFELTSQRTTDDQIVIMTVTFTSVIEPGDYAYIQVFNILLRNCLRNLELKLVGRNYYDPKAKIEINNLKLQLWPGYETTIGMFDSGLLLRTEISTKVMRQETVYDLLLEFMKNSQHDDGWFNKFQAAVIGTTVLTTYNNQTYKIDDVDKNGNIDSTFPKKDGTSISYKDYYFQKWQIKLKYYGQPLLISKKKKVYSAMGEKSDCVYLIPELCTLTGIPQRKLEDRSFMKEFASYTRAEPQERIIRYNNFMKRLLSTPKSAEVLKNWNLAPGSKLVDINARVLGSQFIHSNTSKYLAKPTAEWSSSLRNVPMYTSIKINSWVIVTPNKFVNQVLQFKRDLSSVSRAMSFILEDPTICPIQASHSQAYLTELDKVIKTMNPPLIVCIIPTQRGDTYSTIKRYLCVQRAVPSQVILAKNIDKKNLSVCTKIAIQINCKLGGTPWLVPIPKKNMLIIGFDVCHDKQKQKKSYGALVASLNDSQSVYYSCVTQHLGGEELSNFFSANMLKVLTAFKNLNKMLPSSIIIYRDGVGDGQLSYVHKVELANIKKICNEFYGDVKLQLAFVIVKKRISTRFFTKTNPSENPMPGTVIDTVVTDPSMYDFYLVSQHVTQGTVTPIHYNVIEDTIDDLTPDRMQQLTYKLTHMYFNWSGTVRVPSLCQYAHKLAFFASQVLQGMPNTGLNHLLYFL